MWGAQLVVLDSDNMASPDLVRANDVPSQSMRNESGHLAICSHLFCCCHRYLGKVIYKTGYNLFITSTWKLIVTFTMEDMFSVAFVCLSVFADISKSN